MRPGECGLLGAAWCASIGMLGAAELGERMCALLPIEDADADLGGLIDASTRYVSGGSRDALNAAVMAFCRARQQPTRPAVRSTSTPAPGQRRAQVLRPGPAVWLRRRDAGDGESEAA